jgi:hypothetical protein
LAGVEVEFAVFDELQRRLPVTPWWSKVEHGVGRHVRVAIAGACRRRLRRSRWGR